MFAIIIIEVLIYLISSLLWLLWITFVVLTIINNMAHKNEGEKQIDGEDTDEDVFFGKLTLKEVKKRIFMEYNLQKKINKKATKNVCDSDIKIIETHSQPNLRDGGETKPIQISSSTPGSPNEYIDANESYLTMESVVSKLCLSPRRSTSEQLNNTLEIIDYILKNGPNQNKTDTAGGENLTDAEKISQTPTVIKESPTSPLKKIEHLRETPKMNTPLKTVNKKEVFVTPRPVQPKTPIFKTPSSISHKTPSSVLLKTPNRSNAYQHIKSPVASYIKKCPVIPLLKEVRPARPLPGCSAIPKPLKRTPQGTLKNKENIELPQTVYKSSKKTDMTNIPDKGTLPQNQWAKKIAATLAKPTVIKHEHRQMNFAKKGLLLQKQEDSFNDLSSVQADVSLCSKRTAFKH